MLYLLVWVRKGIRLQRGVTVGGQEGQMEVHMKVLREVKENNVWSCWVKMKLQQCSQCWTRAVVSWHDDDQWVQLQLLITCWLQCCSSGAVVTVQHCQWYGRYEPQTSDNLGSVGVSSKIVRAGAVVMWLHQSQLLCTVTMNQWYSGVVTWYNHDTQVILTMIQSTLLLVSLLVITTHQNYEPTYYAGSVRQHRPGTDNWSWYCNILILHE